MVSACETALITLPSVIHFPAFSNSIIEIVVFFSQSSFCCAWLMYILNSHWHWKTFSRLCFCKVHLFDSHKLFNLSGIGFQIPIFWHCIFTSTLFLFCLIIFFLFKSYAANFNVLFWIKFFFFLVCDKKVYWFEVREVRWLLMSLWFLFEWRSWNAFIFTYIPSHCIKHNQSTKTLLRIYFSPHLFHFDSVRPSVKSTCFFYFRNLHAFFL